MLRTTVACLFALLHWTVAARAEDACRPHRLQTVAIGAGYGTLIVLPARIGERPTRALIDTGSNWSLIQTRLVNELGLKVRSLAGEPYVDVAGGQIRRLVTIPRLSLGALDFSGDFIVLPNDVGAPYGVAIGAAMLSRFDVEIDVTAGAVAFHGPDSACREQVLAAGEWVELPFDFDEQIPELVAQVDGSPVRAVLDTGASRSLMDLRLAKRLFGLTPTSQGVSWRGMHALSSGLKLPLYAYTFKRLGVGNLSFDNVEILLGDFDIVPFTLGMSELKELHLYLAFKRRVIYARRPADLTRRELLYKSPYRNSRAIP